MEHQGHQGIVGLILVRQELVELQGLLAILVRQEQAVCLERAEQVV